MDSKTASAWGAIITSVFSMVIFAGCLCAAFFVRDPGLLNLAIGAAIANASTVVSFWLGSSAGSQRKDLAIEKAAAGAVDPLAGR